MISKIGHAKKSKNQLDTYDYYSGFVIIILKIDFNPGSIWKILSMNVRRYCEIEGCSKPDIGSEHAKTLQRHMAKHHPDVKRSGGRPRVPKLPKE